MSNEIIVVEQLPVITQRLQTIKADVTKRAAEAMGLVCTEDTVTAVKKIRAELNAEHKHWDDKRKEVKKAVMAPYDAFEGVFKDCITDVFKKTDADLKSKIDSVENELKERKAAEVKDYFDEYCASCNIDFLTFRNAGINVTLSASLKSLKERAKAFVDRVREDLDLIDTQEHKDEILYYYKKSGQPCFLDAKLTIGFVITKHKEMEDARNREVERNAKEQAVRGAAEKVDAAVEKLTPPMTLDAPILEEPVFTVKFTVRGTREKLKALKEFLNNKGYDYE